MSTLIKKKKTAEDFEKKVEMFKKTFFLSPFETDLSDIPGFTYPASEESRIEIYADEINKIIARIKTNKTSKLNIIFNRMFKTLNSILIKKCFLFSMFV